MKRFIITAFLVLLVSAGYAQKTHDELTYPEINRFVMPKVETFTLRNGIRVFMVEDNELPLINLNVIVRTGAYLVPDDKAGLHSITGTVMRSGGSVNYPADDLNPLLENRAASIETGIGFTSGSASMNVLKEDFNDLLPVLIDIIRNPLFPEDKIDLAKTQQRSAISRRNDDPMGIASREFQKLIYGDGSVYARNTEYATIDAITRDDLVAFHSMSFVGRNMMISVVGDFRTRDMRRAIERAFGSIPAGKQNLLEFPEIAYDFEPGIFFVPKTDVNQSNVRLGHIGGLRNNPDYAALQMMNQILSGGFSGRLFQEVRTNLGYAYSVGGAYQSNNLYQGQFFVSLGTASANTADAIQASIAEIKKLQESPVSEKELIDARDRILNSLVFRYTSRASVLNEQVNYAYFGQFRDLFDQYIEDLKKVTVADVQRVAKKYLQPESLRILVVGNPNELGDQLSVFGDITEIDITIPRPEVVRESTGGDAAMGQAWIKKMGTALLEDGNTVTSVRFSGVINQGGMQLNASTNITFPNQITQEITTPGGVMKVEYADGAGKMTFGPQEQALPPQQIEGLKKQIMSHYLYLAQHPGEFSVEYLGNKDVDGSTYVALYIDELNATLYLHPETALPARKTVTEFSAMAGADVSTETRYSKWTAAGGVKMAYTEETYSNGQLAGSIQISTHQVE